ncbi:ribosome biogenesis GTP-binding protein YihA/YsxC [Clostridium hydrogenum]|uniref:ribosome biogenesis GTP-binding protein YihA/YsxC n=1 Tax=Clostridium hydrogenum TaxID=2855764 RepID=UPI001EEE3388|nr:ribosome biogenesis GTP-binding protein YihA/YsxC [Clostridium hydrogenum]
MEIKQAEFIISAAYKTQFPADAKVEIAFVGRSNVGKSSIINTLTNRRKLVKTSGTPGKTRLVNFFMINNEFYFVDLPGYGYAKVSKSQLENWATTIENYLIGRRQLKKVILLVDSRHKPSKDDITMYEWIKHFGYECMVVATKSDKITKNEKFKNEKIIRETLQMDKDEKLYFFSSLNRSGKEEILDNLF